MANRKRTAPKRILTGVSLEADVAEYLERLGQEQERSRTYLINRIIRQHARQQRPIHETAHTASLVPAE